MNDKNNILDFANAKALSEAKKQMNDYTDYFDAIEQCVENDEDPTAEIEQLLEDSQQTSEILEQIIHLMDIHCDKIEQSNLKLINYYKK